MAGLLIEAINTAPEFVQKYYVDNSPGYEERLIETLKVLLKNGADPNEDDGRPLFFAVRNGFVKTAQFLLEHGADPGKCDCGYWTAPNSDVRHIITFAERIKDWVAYWKKETALAFEEMFPQKK